MKELIEQLRKYDSRIDRELADALEQQAKQIEELAAALAEKDLLLLRIASTTQTKDLLWWQIDARAALALQPHASLVAKIKADAVREAANDMQDQLVISWDAWRKLAQYADRIEREVK